MPPPRSLNDLMQAARGNIERHRSHRNRHTLTRSHSRRRTAVDTMSSSPDIAYTTRTADQEIDTVAICPAHPEYMVIGTYSLVKPDAPRSYPSQTRQGSIQVLTVSSDFRPRYAGMLPPQLDRMAFPEAIVDIHFHPSDGTLFGAATSTGKVHLFRFIKHGDVLGRRVITKLLPLGSVTVSEPDEHGLSPLVTQFAWLPGVPTKGVLGISDVQGICFAAVTSFGETKIVYASVPRIKDLYDQRVGQDLAAPPVAITDVHKHELEAWTVASLTLPGSGDTEDQGTVTHMILSGGDDSALIASAIDLLSPSELSEQLMAPASASASASPSHISELSAMQLWKDRRNHTAGVVAILPLPPLRTKSNKKDDADPASNGDFFVPLVTGSYDEGLRVFEIDHTSRRATFVTETSLGGGVWRLKVLDQYTTTEGRAQDRHLRHHTLILVSLMHGGAAVLRLTYAPGASESWTIDVLTTFRAGHESMVYCCDAILESPTEEEKPKSVSNHPAPPQPPSYTIVSTSFYDMKICTWTFVDHFKAEHQGQTLATVQGRLSQ
ncbi:hypothetical protein PV08_10464 [Exophiala spinifera]|uniref:Uncharacterized protein n=1 Tax=Exophiala spinifera TaxID=91928 RepID=A0A0D2BIH3_9EURO|nr:uncharacterized protein PV08_10464 [Exophiala spinifera]KIW11164.1 hypothetical protein PV08_10464 [Exophiala spinifera]